MFGNTPEGIHGDKEIHEHADCFKHFLGEHVFIEFGWRGEAVVKYFVDDIDQVSKSVHFNVVQEILVQLRPLRILNDNETSHE
jgi:hypothetical protein